jgi:hypothetical protein
LFPYCAENVQEYLKKHINDDSFKHVIDGLIAEYIRLNQSDSSVNVISDSKDYKGLAENVRYFIKNDLKVCDVIFIDTTHLVDCSKRIARKNVDRWIQERGLYGTVSIF